MWYTNPELWTSAAAVIAAVGGLIRSARAKTRADDAHAQALGHVLDRTAHPQAPPRGAARARAGGNTPGAPGA
jgi:hypothetical protein